MVKKVTAPKTYDPGKGRPKEHLAYLNEREMAYLRSINGNNMERGPRGLPSFPPDDSLGSSSKAGTTSGTSTGKTTGAGGQSGVGGAAGAGGQRGAGSNYGAGSGRPGTTSSNAPAGGQRASTSPTTSTTTTKSNAGPTSPMSSQGASFSSPVFALGANRDYIDRQRTATADATNALRSNMAAKGDLQVGGIRSLSVGPLGSAVNVGKTIAPSAAQAPEGMYGPRIGVGGIGYLSTMAQPGMITTGMPSQYSGSFAGKTPVGAPKSVTQIGNPLMAGGVPTTRLGGPLPAFEVPGPVTIGGVYGPQRPEAETILSVEDVPPERDYTSLYRRATEALARTAATSPFRNPPNEEFNQQYNPETAIAERTRIPNWSQGMPRTMDSIVNVADQETVPVDENGNIYGPETPQNDYVDNAEPTFKDQPEESPFRITGGRFYEGAKDKIADAIPDLFKRPGGSAGFTGDADRGPRRFEPPVRAGVPPIVPKRKNKSTQPKQYASWDAGQNIPSPSDSDYTLYLKYLQEKAAKKASV